jgi:hypothetical protein
MSGIAQNVIYASLAIAGLIGVACLADLIAGVPFGGQSLYDILFLIATGMTAYLGINCLKEAG